MAIETHTLVLFWPKSKADPQKLSGSVATQSAISGPAKKTPFMADQELKSIHANLTMPQCNVVFPSLWTEFKVPHPLSQ